MVRLFSRLISGSTGAVVSACVVENVVWTVETVVAEVRDGCVLICVDVAVGMGSGVHP